MQNIYIYKKKKYVLAAFGLHQICKTEEGEGKGHDNF